MPSETNRRTVRRSRSTVQVSLAAVQDADDVAPRLLRAHSPHRREPGIQLGENAIEVRGITSVSSVADRGRVPGPEAGVAADATAFAGGKQPSLGAFGDQRPFELSDCAQDLQGEHALWGGGIDRIAQAAEMRPLASSCSITARRWLTERASRSSRTTTRVSPAADLAEHPSQHRPVAIGTGGVFFENRGAPGGAELVGLGIGALFFGGDAGVADQAAGGGGKGRGHGAPGVATTDFTIPQGIRK